MTRPTGRRLVAAAALVAIAAASGIAGAAVGAGGDDSAKPVPEAAQQDPTSRLSFLARVIPPAESERKREEARAPNVPRSVADLARRLPIERKVAQLFLVGFAGRDLNAEIFKRLQSQDLGGIVVGRENYGDASLLGQMAGEAVVVARKAKRVPPLVMAEQLGGDFNAFSDLPPSRAPADLTSPADAGREATAAAGTLRSLGVTGVLGPDIDVGVEDDPLGARTYSDDPGEVAAYASASVGAYRRGRVLAAPEHFPGLGSASADTQESAATVGLSIEELQQRDLVPFRAAFKAGVPAVVLSNAFYAPDDYSLPASLSHKIATDLLRGREHFGGIAITDDLADPPIDSISSVPEAAVQALRAGADLIYISGPAADQRAAYVAVLRAVQSGKVSRARLDEAVLRILDAKRNYGLIG